MSQFEELLKSLQATADEQDTTADNADDETIAAAAADSGVAVDGNPEGDAGDGDADDKPVAKSMTAQGADGQEVEVVDATEMLKSLQSGLQEQGSVLAKALGTMTAALQKQGEVIKSLRSEVKVLAGQGRGRKAVVTVSEKPDTTMTKSTPASEGMKPQEFLAKCLDAQKAGKLTALDVARAETAINHGVPVAADIIRNVQ